MSISSEELFKDSQSLSSEEMFKQHTNPVTSEELFARYTQNDTPDGFAESISDIPRGFYQGGMNALGSATKVVSAGALKATDAMGITPEGRTPAVVNEEIDRFFRKDKQQPMQTFGGIAAETAGNVIPFIANLPTAAMGVATMYNDIVDNLVKEGIPLDQARSLAIKENAAMLGLGLVGGAGTAMATSKILSKLGMSVPNSIAKIAAGEGATVASTANATASKLAGGSAGFMGGAEASRQVHNAELSDRPDLQQDFSLKHLLAQGLVGSGLAAMHKSLPKGSEDIPGKDVTPEVDPLFTKGTDGRMSGGEFDILAKSHWQIEKQLDEAKTELEKSQTIADFLGEEVPPDFMEKHKTLQDAVTTLESDLSSIEHRLTADTDAIPNRDTLLGTDNERDALATRLKEQARQRREAEEAIPVADRIADVENRIRVIEESMEGRPETGVKADKAVDNKNQEIQRLRDKLNELNGKLPKDEALPVEEISYPEEAAHPDDVIHATEVVEPSEVAVEPITNRKAPTSHQVANLLREHGTVGEVFATLLREKLGTKGQQKLVSILQRIPHVRDSIFRLGTAIVKDGKASTGSYIKEGNIVELHAGGDIKTILHEAVHAATVHLLDEGKSAAAMALTKLYNDFKKSSKNQGEYGFTNVREFVSEALTNKGFAKLLDGIDTGKRTNSGVIGTMWAELRNIIKDAFGKDKDVRTTLDAILENTEELMNDTSTKPESWFQKMSEGQSEKIPSISELSPIPKVARNYFGINALSNLYENNPRVKNAYNQIRGAVEVAQRAQNNWLYKSGQVISSGQLKFMDTMRNVADNTSAIIALKKTSDADMHIIHDLFRMGFEAHLDYDVNLDKNGQHLTPEMKQAYNTLSHMFAAMHDTITAIQTKIKKAHVINKRKGWYPAKRNGNWSVELGFNGTVGHVQTFSSQHAADQFIKRITNNTNLNHITVSDVIDNRKPPIETNRTMAEIVGEHLANKYPNAGDQLKADIDTLMRVMEARGGKLGQHHKFRTNVTGYKGSELFQTPAESGHAFKVGILGEVENFGANLRGLLIKHTLDPVINDANFKRTDAEGHAVVKTMYDKAMGKIDNILQHPEDLTYHASDRMVNKIMQVVFKKDFQGLNGTAIGQISQPAMAVFYTSKLFAKAVFPLAQIMTTAFILPELAKNNNLPRAIASVGKGIVNLMTHEPDLMESIKRVSQDFGTFRPQILESMNMKRGDVTASKLTKVKDFLIDWPGLGKAGELSDSMSRLISYAAAYTHYKDLGLPKVAAEFNARRDTGRAMTEYGTMGSGAVFDRMGALGTGAKPLTTFGSNQLGNFTHYADLFRKGDSGPLVAYMTVAMITGGALSLQLIQEYETIRMLANKYGDIIMPSIQELLKTDNTFLDRLTGNPNFTNDLLLYGVPSAITGIDLSNSMRSNQTPLAIAGAVVAGQESFWKLVPLVGATLDTVTGLVGVGHSVLGEMGITKPTSVSAGAKDIGNVVSGHFGYGLKHVLNKTNAKAFGEDTGMVAMGAEGNADLPMTLKERIAGYMGTTTTDKRYMDATNWDQSQLDRIRAEKIQKAAATFTETKDRAALQKMIDLGMTGEEIENKIGTDTYNKFVPSDIRGFMNKGGTINDYKATHRIPFMRK